MANIEASLEASDDLECLTRVPSGRGRPEKLKSFGAESAFLTTIVMSLMISEYFIAGFNVIVQPVANSLGIPLSQRSWSTVAITITTASLMLPFARLCDIYGYRRVFLFGQSWMVLWSLIGGFSTSGLVLIVCRAMQGVGPAAFVPAGVGLLGSVYRPGPRKNFVFGLYSIFASIGFFCGIFAGALAAKYLNWRWYFWIGACIGTLICVLGYISIPLRTPDTQQGASMDWYGTLTIVPGLVLVVFATTTSAYALHSGQTPYVYCAFTLGILFLAAAIYTQGWVSKEPLLPSEIFKTRYMKRLVVALFSAYGAFGLFLYYAASYIENIIHTTPMTTAAWFTPLVAGGICLAIGGGWIMHITSNQLLMVISALGFLCSMILFLVIPPYDVSHDLPSTTAVYWTYIFPAMLCCTIGVDITFIVSNVFVTTASKERLQATVGGLLSSVFSLSLAFWLGLSELIASSVSGADGDKLNATKQYRVGFFMGVALSLVYLGLTLTIRIEPASASLTADERAEVEEAEQAPAQ